MRSRLLKTGAAALAVATAGTALYLGALKPDGVTGFGSGSSPLATAAIVQDGKDVTPGVALTKAKVDSARVDFFIDGWSARILKSATVTATVGTKQVPVRLRPVSGADLKELLKDSPGLVEAALARQVSGASDIACDTSGCFIDGKGVDLVRWVTSPSKVRGFGDMYKGWGVGSLLYHFSVDAGDGSEGVSVGLKDTDATAVVFPAVSLSGMKSPAPEAGNGYLANRYLLGSAFERLFVLDPEWLLDPKAPARYNAELPDDVPVLGDMPTRTVHHTLGLSSPWPGTEGFSDSVLTYLSSPTGGCDVGVICAPDRIEASIAEPVHEQQRVCAVIDGERVDQIAVFDSAAITATFPHKTSQFGLWGGKTVPQFGKSVGLLRGGLPPLVEGEQTWRWDTVGLLNGSDGAVRVTAGTFTPGTGVPGTLAQTLKDVSLDGHDWEPCADPDPEDNPLSEETTESGTF